MYVCMLSFMLFIWYNIGVIFIFIVYIDIYLLVFVNLWYSVYVWLCICILKILKKWKIGILYKL